MGQRAMSPSYEPTAHISRVAEGTSDMAAHLFAEARKNTEQSMPRLPQLPFQTAQA
jgi:hypothetical protein